MNTEKTGSRDRLSRRYDNVSIVNVNDTFARFGISSADPDLLPDARPNAFPDDHAFMGIFHYHEKQSSVFGTANYYFTPAIVQGYRVAPRSIGVSLAAKF